MEKTFPVDFGQVYPSTHKLYGLSLPIVRKEIAQLKKRVKSQREDPRFIPIEAQIENLKHYKSTLTGNDELSQNKVKHIDRFILDTQHRIQAFKDGNKHAFDTYVQDNRPAINVLHQNRTTNPLVKTILTILFTGIVPGLLVGAIQWIASKGNSFLFTERQTQSEKKTSSIQDNILGAINGTSSFRKSLEKGRSSEMEERESDTEQKAIAPRN